jgi:alkanesulfonate monooxygenase SsuD/methylene tetrahydromethanopterin reductase-like flavin-dependent oxidoreductase (luciferase family)
VWRACWAPGKVSFSGRFVTFDDMHVSPKPLQQPHPPIWVGGSSDAALRRAAAFATVWQPTPTPVADLIERQTSLREACERIGRQPPPESRMSFRVELSSITGNKAPSGSERPIGHGTPGEIAADLVRYREAARVNAFQINFHGNRNLGQLLDSMDCFMREVKPLVL